MSVNPVHWVSVFLDTPPDLIEADVAYWTAVTASKVGEAMGDQREYLPLDPDVGDPCLWFQRIEEGPVASHPDLYVEDVVAQARRAVGLGTTQTRASDGLVVLSSPAGLPFCLVRHRGQCVRPEPVGTPGERSVVDQICLDIPPARFEDECRFWSALTGWQLMNEPPKDEFDRLRRPEGIPYAFLLQRLDDEQPVATAHLDLSADDRAAEIARHEALGAQVVRAARHWTVMRDPVGRVYCITARRPGDV